MWNSYWTFLDYLELRRRVERRVGGGLWLFLHIGAFIAVVVTLLAPRPFYWINSYFIEPGAGQIMAIWSLILAIHGVWTFARSGAAAGARSRAIETEMRERLRNDDTYLSDNPKDLFRLHGLLEDDLRRRSSPTWVLTMYSIANALMWIPWAVFNDARDSFPWQMTPMTAVFLLLPMLAFSVFSRSRREGRLRQQMENLSDNTQPREETPKQKRFAENVHMRLTDDGELVTIEDEMDAPKSKRR